MKYVSFVNFLKKHIWQFCQISGPENFKEYLIWQFSQNTSGYFGKEGGPHNLTNATFANFQMSYNLKIEPLPIKKSHIFRTSLYEGTTFISLFCAKSNAICSTVTTIFYATKQRYSWKGGLRGLQPHRNFVNL